MRYADVQIEGGPLASGVTIKDTATGESIKGVCGAEVVMLPEKMIEVRLTICSAALKLSGKPTFMLADPRNGKMKPIAKVIFADGTEFEPIVD